MALVDVGFAPVLDCGLFYTRPKTHYSILLDPNTFQYTTVYHSVACNLGGVDHYYDGIGSPKP